MGLGLLEAQNEKRKLTNVESWHSKARSIQTRKPSHSTFFTILPVMFNIDSKHGQTC